MLQKSENVPGSFRGFSSYFMCGPTNVGIGIPIEFFESIIDLLFKSLRRTITDDVENAGSDAGIRIFSQLEDTIPELFDIVLHLARA